MTMLNDPILEVMLIMTTTNMMMVVLMLAVTVQVNEALRRNGYR